MNVVVTYMPVMNPEGKEVFPAELFREPEWHWDGGALWLQTKQGTTVIPAHRIWRVETVEGVPQNFVSDKEPEKKKTGRRKS